MSGGLRRSLLFVPGNRPERFDKALAAGADAVVIDLEDAVPAAAKGAARDAVADWLAPQRPVMLRINAAGSDWHEQDLALCEEHPGITAVMLPKAEGPEPVRRLAVAGLPVLPLVESAAAVAALVALVRAPGVERLVFGSIDLQADLGMRDALEEELNPLRLQLVMQSRLAGIAAPIDGVTTAVDDPRRLAEDARRGRRLGFAGKLCIHPRQVGTVNRCYAPDEAEVRWAMKVLQAAAAAGGDAVRVDGAMVDRAVLFWLST